MTYPILVIGRNGQLARALRTLLSQDEAVFWDRQSLDLSADKDVILEKLNQTEPISGIIIAAAYTAVDQAETEAKTAYAVNATAPAVISDYCQNHEIPLVHVSTDYVFQGHAKAPYKAEDLPDPINTYGASKLAGEQAIKESGANAAILRTSWVFDGTGKNFMTTMLRLGAARESLSIVADQVGRPTYAKHLAEACLDALQGLINQKIPSGLYHVTGSGVPISWADFAEAIFSRTSDLRPHTINIKHITSAEYPTPAARPHYSVLDLSKFEKAIGKPLPSWQLGLDSALTEYRSTL